ncbi:hypothetical protein B0H12DRAFT_1143291 [Mycena haematopus]|nr:hypothetical protein B0H12DRAFT_1143291 [Mycena haematopus]
MAGLSPQVKALLNAYIVLCTVVSISYLPPVLIERHYPAAAPVAAVFVWITDTGSRALAAAMFVVAIAMLGLLLGDAYKGLARSFSSNTSTGPIALEDGTSVPALPEPTTQATPPPTLTLTVPQKLFLLFTALSFCAQNFVLSGVVYLDRTLWHNVGTAAMHIGQGLQVLETLFGVFLVFVWLRKLCSRGAARAQQADDAPVDGGDEKAALVVEDSEKKASVV